MSEKEIRRPQRPIDIVADALKKAAQGEEFGLTQQPFLQMLNLHGEEKDGRNFDARFYGDSKLPLQVHPINALSQFRVTSMLDRLIDKLKAKQAYPQEIELARILARAAEKQVTREGDICETARGLLLKAPSSIVDPKVRLLLKRHNATDLP